MTLSDMYAGDGLALSFELFPPKTEKGMANLKEQLRELVTCGPSYVTCTYGAGGSTRGRTLEVLAGVRKEHPALPVASHLTLVGASKDDLRTYIRDARGQGISYLVALRGDPPQGETAFTPAEDGLRYANELVEMIRAEFPDMGTIVAGYPEVHPEAPDAGTDLDNLKRKVDAGADVIITQLFYDNALFFRFRDRCTRLGIGVPIVPGVLPVTNLAQIKRITSFCGSTLPDKLLRRLERHDGDTEGQYAVGVYHAARQVEELVEQGVPGVHFYVLNKSRATALICRALTLH